MAKSKTIKDVEAEEKVTKKTKKAKEVKADKVESETKEESINVIETKEEKKKEKEEKKNNKEAKKQVEKKDGYFKVLGRELKKVVWPNAGEIAKYSIAVIVFCLVLILFFLGVEALASFIKGLF